MTRCQIRIVGLCALLFPLLLLTTLAGATNTTQKSELRCGWFDNPTPANASLLDRDGEWIIGIQGEHQADGDWPEFKPNEWVNTNQIQKHLVQSHVSGSDRGVNLQLRFI